MKRLNSRDPHFTEALRQLHDWDANLDPLVENRVREILAAVRERGDAALLEYSARFDGLHLETAAELEIPRRDWEEALAALSAPEREALEEAAHRIRGYHERQKLESWQYREADGTLLGQRVLPLARVGIYVPGGKAAYPSSVLMNALPARVAGVGEIHMTVPTPRGEVNPWVLAAAAVAGDRKSVV